MQLRSKLLSECHWQRLRNLNLGNVGIIKWKFNWRLKLQVTESGSMTTSKLFIVKQLFIDFDKTKI